MKLTEGAASSWANLRSATRLIFTNRRHLPVVNRLSVSGQANDWIGMDPKLPVNRLTGKSGKIETAREDASPPRGWPCPVDCPTPQPPASSLFRSARR
jgi:hypothetical protein